MLHGVLLCYQFWSVFDGENWNRTWYRGCRGYYGSTGYNVRVTTFSYNAVEIYRKLILLFNIRGMYSFGHPKSPQNDLFSMYQDRIPFTWCTWFVVQAKMARKYWIPVVSTLWLSCCSLLQWVPLQMTAVATMIIELHQMTCPELHQMTCPHQWIEEGGFQSNRNWESFAPWHVTWSRRACLVAKPAEMSTFTLQCIFNGPNRRKQWWSKRRTISGQGVCIQTAFIAWPNIQKHCWPLSLKLREKGMGGTKPMVAVKAAQISESFNDKTRLAQYHSLFSSLSPSSQLGVESSPSASSFSQRAFWARQKQINQAPGACFLFILTSCPCQ